MARLWTSMVAVALGLGMAGAAFAGEGWGHGSWGHRGGWDRGDWPVPAYVAKHGVKFEWGYFYPGKLHKHWSETWWDEEANTHLYFDPYMHMPYYWCEGHGRYYPINYIETVPPNAPPLKVVGKGGPAVVGGGAPVGGGAAPVGGGAAPPPVGGGAAPAAGAPAGGPAPAGGAAPVKVVDDIPPPTGGAGAGAVAAKPAGGPAPVKPVSTPKPAEDSDLP